MPFEKGISGNPLGRPTGAKNQNTELKERIEILLNDSFDIEIVKADLVLLKPKERLEILIKLFQYILPTMKSVETSLVKPNTDLLTLLSPPRDEIE